jgi:hypothetical protein
MNKQLLSKHIQAFLKDQRENPQKHAQDKEEHLENIKFFQAFTKERLLNSNEEEFYNYFSNLWAMKIWGNKRYIVDKLINDNGLENLKGHLTQLLYSMEDIEKRWDDFKLKVKGIGPAMMSELLCKTFPEDYMLWNRRAYVGLNYLQVKDLPRYDYQLTGEVYMYLCEVSKEIASEMKKAGILDTSLLAVDFFIWRELQVEENLSKIHSTKTKSIEEEIKPKSNKEADFIHNDVRDKIADIGSWLGFNSKVEIKVSDGSKVDAIWEATIGNMGRVIYVFEVQTKGSVDSLILNLLKSLNNPAVQGVVAVSDKDQLEKIKKHANDVKDLRDKLKYWDYEEILKIHEGLEYINSSINELGLVPQGF